MNLSTIEDIEAINPKYKNVFKSSIQIINDLHQEVRNISFDIMPSIISMKGLEPTIEEFIQKINAFGKITISLSTYKYYYRFSSDAEIAIYRVIQEIINNILKHSDAGYSGDTDHLFRQADHPFFV